MNQPNESPRTAAVNPQNFAIGVLSTTAVILLVGLLVMGRLSDVAHAGPMTVSGGDYTLAVGRLNTRDEMLYIIDSPSQRLGMYRFDSGAKKIDLVAGQDLGQIRNQVEGNRTPQDPNQVPQDPRNRRPDRRRRP